MRTITAMFDSRADAENARFRLSAAGMSEDNVSIHDKGIMGDHDNASHREPAYAGDETRGVSDGQPPAGASDGRAGTHRDALGNFVDNRTDKPVGSDFGSDRNLLGDFVDGGDRRRGDEGSDGGLRLHANGDDGRGLWDRIKDFFTDDDDVYAEGLRRGGYLLSARVEDHDVDRAVAILDVDGVVDLQERQATWRQDGWSGGSRPQVDREGRGERVRTHERADWPL